MQIFSFFYILHFVPWQALESGELTPGGVVTEGSAGSTAISLATVAPAYGCKCHVVIPDDVAAEKVFIVTLRILYKHARSLMNMFVLELSN